MKSKQAESASPGYMSPPARGAWIEIVPLDLSRFKTVVAPREGGVD